MIVVKVELHSAITGEVTEIGRTYIHNKGGTTTRGEYAVNVCKKGSKRKPIEMFPDAKVPYTAPRAQRTGEVLDYPRRSHNIWRLISRALRSAFPEEK